MATRNVPITLLILLTLVFASCSPWDVAEYLAGSRKLEDVDKEKYDYVKKIAVNPIFERREKGFYVSYQSFVSFTDVYSGKIYISFLDLDSPCLDWTVYHEMGHLQDGVGPDQVRADYFPVLIMGPDRAYECLEKKFSKFKHKVEWPYRLDVYLRLFAINNGLKSEEELEEYVKKNLLKK